MATRSPGSMSFQFTLGRPSAAARPTEGTPFRMLVMADFSGRGAAGRLETGAALAARPCLAVDADSLDRAIARTAPVVRMAVGDSAGSVIQLAVRELDDFHPDRVLRQLDVFRALENLRQQLRNPATFAEAAALVRTLSGTEPPASEAASQAGEPAPPAEADMFDRLLGRPRQTPAASAAAAPIRSILEEAVREHIVPSADPRQSELVGLVEEAMEAQMRAILHHPAFQAIESVWRGVHFLVSRLDLGEELRLHLLDVSRQELMADLAAPDLSRCGLYKLLAEQSVGVPGSQPWALIVGDFAFDAVEEDAALLARLGAIAQHAGAAFIAGASSNLVGSPSFADSPDPDAWSAPAAADAWNQLRRLPSSRHVALACPRMMLRLPYGSGTDPVESLRLEEWTPRHGHEQYLWGNAAYACAAVLAQAFTESGWEMSPAGFGDVEDLPMHVRSIDGESQITPPTEAYLSDRAAAAIMARGLVPLLSIRGRPAARFAGFASLADPPAPLAGRWS